MYKKVFVYSSGVYYFVSDKNKDAWIIRRFVKKPYDFLLSAYNDDLESILNVCTASSLIPYDPNSYNDLRNFLQISDEDKIFIKAIMLLLTHDSFSSEDIIKQLLGHDIEDTQTSDDFLDDELNEYSKRLVLLNTIRRTNNFPYSFPDAVNSAISALRNYDIEDKLAYNVRVKADSSFRARLFGYEFDSFLDAILFEIYNIINSNITIKLCKNCDKLFVPQRSDALYCDNPAPQNQRKTCKEYGGYIQRQTNIRSDISTQLYRRIYMRKQMQYKRNPNNSKIRQDYEAFKTNANDWKKRIKAGKATNDDFTEWLINQS